MKYGTWAVSGPKNKADVERLRRAGYSPITAAVLCSRGYDTPELAREFLACDRPLSDPFELLDMEPARARVQRALDKKEHICVFGDYDVDGITATCLMTEFLRGLGGHVTSYIPARLEEGYGLNPLAIDTLKKQGVQLIVTVDCGITANAEAALCRELGIDLVITDHHECKTALPEAAAIVDPHRCTSWRAPAWRSSSPAPSAAIRRRCSTGFLTSCASAPWRTSCPSRVKTARWSRAVLPRWQSPAASALRR